MTSLPFPSSLLPRNIKLIFIFTRDKSILSASQFSVLFLFFLFYIINYMCQSSIDVFIKLYVSISESVD